jgi:hypothetical protein
MKKPVSPFYDAVYGTLRLSLRSLEAPGAYSADRGERDRTSDILFPKQARYRCATPRDGLRVRSGLMARKRELPSTTYRLHRDVSSILDNCHLSAKHLAYYDAVRRSSEI